MPVRLRQAGSPSHNMKNAAIALALIVVVLGPIVLRPKGESGPRAGERTLVVITPHNESIRHEFGRAFAQRHLATTGQHVRLDFRTPGGTSEITRTIDSEYTAAFEHYWRQTLRREWSKAVEGAFLNSKITLDDTPADDTPEQQARRAFLASAVSCKFDLFFGGGSYDFQQAANKGQLIDSGFIREHPELFGDAPGQIPQTLSGEPFWDPKGRWIGNVVSSFGIVFNTDSLRRLGIAQPPAQWRDLADPRYFHQIALANPMQSSSVNKSFEMLIQQQIFEYLQSVPPDESMRDLPLIALDWRERAAVREGWQIAMRLLMRIGANARYFTDSSTKISLDVEGGEAAAGMTIDFYGRFQSEAVRRPDGSSRLQYTSVAGGSSVGVDPIGIFRGAPNADIAKDFIAFLMSADGQRLWNWKVGAPGGTHRYALRRMPVLPALYAPEFHPLRSDPEVNPYELAKTFTYHPKWTGHLFRPVSFIFRVMCIDTHDELTAAWGALIDAQFPPEAMAAFEDVNAVAYDEAGGRIRDALTGDKIAEVQLAKELADKFRTQYRRAAELARAGR